MHLLSHQLVEENQFIEIDDLSFRGSRCVECSCVHAWSENTAVNNLRQATVGVTGRRNIDVANACGQHVRPGPAATARQAG